ncbi:MAG: ATP-binding protein, partial [Desulfurispora sp.]|uniref:ATP-binding protein n=1 Tax=Desulfurispora sp. TaxID=3014275 RepID=UPI00404B521A
LAGSKLAARERAAAAGVPVLPGSPQGVTNRERALAVASEIGYPVILKASAGGGGRGMRICRDGRELAEELAIARAEAAAAFGDGTLYLEKYLVRPRHIEVQILGDRYGRLEHLGERECSVQRRYQKLVEESPSPALDEQLRLRMGAAALQVAAALGYSNAGTVEFLLDDEQNFYFMEINARLQVEHPVTEMVRGVDLVQEQIRLAAGETLSARFQPAGPRGWAIECRINAEDPQRGFWPAPGTIQCYRPPGGPGVRLDTHIYQGYQVPPYYDSLLAKLVAWGPDRPAALRVMQRALAEFVIAPISTTLELHRQIMADADFQAGRYDTGFVQRFLPPDEEDD